MVVATTGSAPNGATPRRGQAKSSPRPAGDFNRLALHQHAGDRDVVGRGTRIGAAEQAVLADIGGGGERHHRAGERPRRSSRRVFAAGACGCGSDVGSATATGPRDAMRLISRST